MADRYEDGGEVVDERDDRVENRGGMGVLVAVVLVIVALLLFGFLLGWFDNDDNNLDNNSETTPTTQDAQDAQDAADAPDAADGSDTTDVPDADGADQPTNNDDTQEGGTDTETTQP